MIFTHLSLYFPQHSLNGEEIVLLQMMASVYPLQCVFLMRDDACASHLSVAFSFTLSKSSHLLDCLFQFNPVTTTNPAFRWDLSWCILCFRGLLLSWESHHSFLFICSQSPVNQETMKGKLCQNTTLVSEQEIHSGLSCFNKGIV